MDKEFLTKITQDKKYLKCKKLIEKEKIDPNVVLNNKIEIETYVDKHIVCQKNQPCQQFYKGFKYDLIFKNNRFYNKLTRCIHSQDQKIINDTKLKFVYSDFHEDFFAKSIKMNFNLDLDRTRAYLATFAKEFLKGNQNKGLYLHGSVGSGKTFFLSLLAVDLARNEKYKKIGFISVPNLIQKLKDSITWDVSFKRTYDKLRTCDILFLDDIGSEIPSSWSRDDALFGIINYRYSQKLPTFFSSNFSPRELMNIYSSVKEKDYQEFALVKVERLMDRILGFTKIYELKGKSQRHKNRL